MQKQKKVLIYYSTVNWIKPLPGNDQTEVCFILYVIDTHIRKWDTEY